MGSIEDRDIVVEFLVLSRPIYETPCNWMLLVRVDNFDRLLGLVTAGLQTEILEPLRMRSAKFLGLFAWFTDAVRVHCAMEIHTRSARFVRRENTSRGGESGSSFRGEIGVETVAEF